MLLLQSSVHFPYFTGITLENLTTGKRSRNKLNHIPVMICRILMYSPYLA